MTEKAEDDILLKRAETEAAGKAVYSDDLRLTVQPSCLQNGTLREYQLGMFSLLLYLPIFLSLPVCDEIQRD